MFRNESPLRALASAADGEVIALGGLSGSRYAKCSEGDGFAVLPPRGLQKLRISAAGAAKAFLDKPQSAGLYSPTDGVVTALNPNGRLSLRTCDGIEVCVFFGGGAELYTDIGERLALAQQFGTLCEGTQEGCAAVVLITQPERITELHIETGARLGGQKTAYYKALL